MSTAISRDATPPIAHAPYGSVQPQLRNQPRVGFQLVTLHALDEVGQHGIGAARQTKLLALAHHKTVDEFDFGAAAFLHVLAHRGTLPRGSALGVRKTLL